MTPPGWDTGPGPLPQPLPQPLPEPLIVTFANAAYIPIARNWLAAVDRAGAGARARIIALDAATQAAFPPERVLYRPFADPSADPSAAPKTAAELAPLWAFRIRVLRDLLTQTRTEGPESGPESEPESGPGLIHSDADAVWMQDPRPMIAACATDMVFTQGTIWPPDVHARHGIVLCCGLFCLRDTPAVARFLTRLEARVVQDRDDQVSVNRLLDEDGMDWEVPDPYRIPFRDTAFVASRAVILSRPPAEPASGSASGSARADPPPSVAILPHHLFPRLMDAPDPGVIVAHPMSPKSCEAKIAALTRLGLWI
jgi:hypothetical protein